MSFISNQQAQQIQNNNPSPNAPQNNHQGAGQSKSQGGKNQIGYYYLAPLSGFDTKDLTTLVSGINIQLTGLGTNVNALSQMPGTPVNGNLFASVSAVASLLKHINNSDSDYAPLAIDLLGCLTEEGGNEANAVTILRPILHKVRDAYLRQPKEEKGQNPLKASDIALFKGHMNTLNAGELKKLVTEAQGKLGSWLDRASILAKNTLGTLTTSRSPSPTNPVPSFPDPVTSNSKNWYAPSQTSPGIWQALQSVSEQKSVSANNAGALVGNLALKQEITLLQAKLAKGLKAQSGTKEMELGFFLQKLNEALKDEGDVLKTTAVVEGQPARVVEEKKEGVFEALASVCLTEDCSNGCKDGSCSGSGTQNSIGFALGEERIGQVDFSLPGVMPLVWNRVYRSNLITYDKGPLGARWTNNYLTRIDIRKNEWLLNTADGRIVKLPKLKIGEIHRDVINGFNVAYLSDELISLTFGHDQIQLFARQGDKHYKLYMVRDNNGNTIELRYDRQYRLVLIDNHTNKHSLSFSYNQKQQIEEVNLHHSNPETIIGDKIRTVAQYQYDNQGNLIAATDEYDDTRRFEYDGYHRVTRYTDRTDFGMNLQWQGRRHKARAIRENADDGSRETRLDWQNGLRMTTITNALGQSLVFFCDINGYPVRSIYPSGREDWYFRDPCKNILKKIAPDGRATSFSYDWQDNLLSSSGNDSSKTFFEYNEKSQLIKTTDANGHMWRNEYDPKGNLVKAIDPKGCITQYQYNEQGLTTSIIDPKGGINKLEYNSAGQLIKQTDCSGKSSELQYNSKGQLLGRKDAAGHEIQYQYNKKGQLQKTIYPDGKFLTYQYDAEGRLLSSKDHLGRESHTEYDAGYFPFMSIDPLGRQTRVQRNRIGMTTQLIDANGAIYQWQYDDKTNQLLQESNFAGKSTHYTYDGKTGELIQKQESGGNPIYYEYDEMGRLVRQYTDNQSESFIYDQMGQLIQTQNLYSKTQYFYDSTGNLTKEIQEITRLGESTQQEKYIKRYIWHYKYDVLGNRITTIRPDGQRIDHLIYGSGHIHGILLNQQPLVDFERDDLHREIARQYANKVEQQYTFNKEGSLQQLAVNASNPQLNNQKDYHYNPQGLISQIYDQQKGNQTYQYDIVGRLIHAQNIDFDEHFQYDNANNLLDPLNTLGKQAENYTGNYDLQGKFSNRMTETDYQSPIDQKTGLSKLMGNLLKEYNGNQYRYDARGNLVQKSSPNGINSYEWNDFNQLTKLTNHKGTTYYRYDTFGRRIYKKSPDGKETYYLWEGDNMVMEDNNYHIHHYIYEPSSFAPLAQFNTNAENNPVQVYFYHNDHLGTPEQMADETGNLVWTGTKAAYGQMYEQTSTLAKLDKVTNPIRFQGQYFDEESGLHYNRFRYYDPETGRYISEDPIKLGGGFNLYGYPMNPVEWSDPLGLQTVGGNMGQKIDNIEEGRFAKVTIQGVAVGSDQAYNMKVMTCAGGGIKKIAESVTNKTLIGKYLNYGGKGAGKTVEFVGRKKIELYMTCEEAKRFNNAYDEAIKAGKFARCGTGGGASGTSGCITNNQLRDFLNEQWRSVESLKKSGKSADLVIGQLRKNIEDSFWGKLVNPNKW